MPSFIWSILATLLLLPAEGDRIAEMVTPGEEADAVAAESLSPEEEPSGQISLERVIVVRIPRAERVPDGATPHGADRPTIKCLPMSAIAAMFVSSAGSLDLMTREGRYRAYLPAGCDARQFYSGFYIEKPEDGRFCVGREELHARSGTMCQVQRLVSLGP